MTQEEKNAPITFGMLESIFKEIEEPLTSNINALVIAKITLCGAFEIPVYDYMDWNPPTSEQIKNLKEMLNIDVKLIGGEDTMRTYRIYEEGYRATGESVGAHYVGEAEGKSFIDACKNYIEKNNYGRINIDSHGNEYAADWGCRWFPTLEEAQKSFG